MRFRKRTHVFDNTMICRFEGNFSKQKDSVKVIKNAKSHHDTKKILDHM